MKFPRLLLPVALGIHLSCLAAETKPNILVILADDLGYGDVQCYQPERGKIKTPHIDRLAAQGMRFTDGHTSSGVCSPTRYALLTGRYHWRTSLQRGIVPHLGKPLIAPDRLTIAGLAKQHASTAPGASGGGPRLAIHGLVPHRLTLHDGRMTPNFNYALERSVGGASRLHATEFRPRVCEPNGKAQLT
ncbi:MAG: hypothetical protein EXS37_17535 [Opitutus sp.]|nr:hypothetical protein [Opitutus sp.]